ncbi:hypothetical protein JOY44_04355 [Phormidium sp. CLA17]|uniref:hypothetical protein n=1 Tax=Leptolyngbya sp. Cla-17 TaxID=2803751 RepID=UPI0014914311|nr:hypothetical protein [Leptolyngbya sp. Cla-17]MBM0740855.1 hypothetical protein [Leptolyngbya sp. Cla-17]
MDPLPLTINRSQLDLMHNSINQAIEELKNRNAAGDFSPDSGQQEQNLLTYGASDFPKAQGRLQEVEVQLQTKLNGWSGDPNLTQSVPIALDSYQVQLMRSQLEHHRQGSDDNAQLVDEIINQLPENSPNENSD